MTQTSTSSTSTSPTSTGPEAAVAVTAAVCAVGLAIYQVATPGPPEPTFESFSDWLREALTMGFLVSSIGAAFMAARHRLAPSTPARLVIGGYGLIAAGVAAGMALRDDPDWFMLLGAPGQLLSMVGFIWWAVAGWRGQVMPGSVALLAGVGGVVAFLGAELGLTVLIGAFWFWVAGQLRPQPSVSARSSQTKS